MSFLLYRRGHFWTKVKQFVTVNCLKLWQIWHSCSVLPSGFCSRKLCGQRTEGDTQLLSVALCVSFLREMPNTERLFYDALLAQAVWTKGFSCSGAIKSSSCSTGNTHSNRHQQQQQHQLSAEQPERQHDIQQHEHDEQGEMNNQLTKLSRSQLV